MKMNDSNDIFIFTKNYNEKEDEYICQYRSNKGEICEQSYMRAERCSIY